MDDFRRQFTWGAVALLVVGAVIAAVMAPLGQRFFDWALPGNTTAPALPQGTKGQPASTGGPVTPSPSKVAAEGATTTGNSCDDSQGHGWAVATAKVPSALTFCPTLVNNGELPQRGPSLPLSGRILGLDSERQRVILLVQVDPATRDTCGKAPGVGHFFLADAKLHERSDGRWSHVDNYGDYPQGVTFGRTYEFATAPQDVVQNMINSRETWKDSGMSILPAGVTVLATFTVGPGQEDATTACNSR